jgi:Putative Flp pilus-assembly TadE/G-like
MCAPFRTALRRLRADESGQSLIIVALSMTLVVAVAAFAIDVGTWYAKHHQAQVVADSAALAAANCLANPGHSTTMNIHGTVTAVPACSSGTDTADATTVAEDYAAANGITVTSSDISFTPSTNPTEIEVNPHISGPTFFANLIGIHATTESASAGAGWTAGSSSSACTNPSSGQCAAIYAGNTACSGSGISLQLGSGAGFGVTVEGGVHSEGQANLVNAGFNWGAGSTFTVTKSCYTSSNAPNFSGKQSTVVASEPWPINYGAAPYFSACTTNCTTVSGVPNVPPYCTQATTSASGYVFQTINPGQANASPEPPGANQVYCSIGTGNSKDPSTWNGTFQFLIALPVGTQNGSQSSCTSFQVDTFIGGNMQFPGTGNGPSGVCLKPDMFNCVMYSTGTIQMSNAGSFYWLGDIFDPTGTVDFGSAGSGISAATASGMVESLNFYDQNASLNLVGDGPMSSTSTSTTTTGTDTLLQ